MTRRPRQQEPVRSQDPSPCRTDPSRPGWPVRGRHCAPARYNGPYDELRGEGKNLTSLVAWEHARAIRDLPGHGVRAQYAVTGKSADERYLPERLRTDTRRDNMRLEHRTKAESDVAVAAASILARDRFVGWLEQASEALGTTLPKGAGPQVITTGRALVAAHGPGILREYAKVSFKTTRAVLKSPP